MNYGQDIEILIWNIACHVIIERQGRALWSPRDLSYLISPTASLLQWFPAKFSDKIPLWIKNHNPGVGHHNLSLQLWQLIIIYYQHRTGEISPAKIHRRSSRPSAPASRPFSSLFSWRKRQKTIRTFVSERLGANWRHYLSLLLRHLYFISDHSWPSLPNIK